MYSYVLRDQVSMGALPKVALQTIPTKRASLDGVNRYARALTRSYPEQKELIQDIANAATSVHDRSTTKNLFEQLVDLERYLISTLY